MCRLQGRVAPAEAAQIHRMQAKQEEKAELEAILAQVRHILANDCELLMTFVSLLRALQELLIRLQMLTTALSTVV